MAGDLFRKAPRPFQLPFLIKEPILGALDASPNVAPTETVAAALSLLHKRAHGAIVIVENGKPIGEC